MPRDQSTAITENTMASPIVTVERGVPLEEIRTNHGLRRLHYVDGMRAVAALWVVLLHGWQPANPIEHLPVLGFLFRIITVAQPPVLIFLVLSGFCLYYPLVLKNPLQPVLKTTYAAFVARRARRILPPFYGAMSICVLAIITLPLMRQAAPQDDWSQALPLSGSAVLSHLLMVHNLFSLYWKKIDYPAWTIGLEWQLYLFFPLLVWLFRTKGAGPVLGLAFLITLAARVLGRKLAGPVGFALNWSPLSYCLIFVAGMYAASCTVRGLNPRIPRWGLGLMCVCAFGVVFFRGLHGTGLETGAFLLVPVGTVCLLLLAAEPQSAVHRLFSARWLVAVGVFSYSVYLLHAPFLHVFLLLLSHTGLNAFWKYAVICFGVTPIIVGISYLFFMVFEKPFIGMPQNKKMVSARPETVTS